MATYQIPVYLFVGFLEGGKTRMIQETMENEKFNNGQKTLILLCEEGEEELDPSRFASKNCYLEVIEDESDINLKNLTEIAKKHKLDRIVIEYNGMWQLGTLYENMPLEWAIFQQVMFADAKTFVSYNANMRSLMVDKLMGSEMVVLNRVPDGIDKMEIHKIVRGVSRSAQIAYDYPDGHIEYDDIQDPLPFDINAPIIKIEDIDFAIWYRDLSEEMDEYQGKTVAFKALVARDPKLPKNAIIVGRPIMTCCADDIAYSGLICSLPATVVSAPKNREWIYVTAKVNLEEHKLYGGKRGPVLYATSCEPTKAPEDE